MARFRDRLADYVYKPVHYVGGLVLVALMLLSIGDVTGRYFFSSPIPGTFELTEMAMIFIAFAGLAYSQHRGEHITIDLVVMRFPPRLRAAVGALTTLVSFALAVALAWQLGNLIGRLARSGETTAVLSLPLAPFAAAAAIGFGLFALALLFDLIDAIRGLFATR